jgi:pimeloyl-ACP methyl ester carboxylesterase
MKIRIILKRFQKPETILNQTLNKQIEAAANAPGTCDRLKNITQPTLVIVGTDDAATPATNSLRMAELIPGSWFVQLKEEDMD